jgi:hypothetical protein
MLLAPPDAGSSSVPLSRLKSHMAHHGKFPARRISRLEARSLPHFITLALFAYDINVVIGNFFIKKPKSP